MDKYVLTDGGRELNMLGERYINLVRQGHGTNPDNRTSEQIEIANDIVVKSRNFIRYVAKKMCTEGWEINKSGRRISVNGFHLDMDDLVSEGTVEVLEHLQAYNPKCAMTTFIGQRVASRIHKFACQDSNISIPLDIFNSVRGESFRFDYVGEERIKLVSPYSVERRWLLDSNTIGAIYACSFGKDFLDMDAPSDLGESFVSKWEDKEKWQDFLLKDGGCDVGGKGYYVQLEDRVSVMLAKLKPKAEDVVRMHFGIGGRECSLKDIEDKYCVSHDLIRYIEARALSRLRHFAEYDELEFLS